MKFIYFFIFILYSFVSYSTEPNLAHHIAKVELGDIDRIIANKYLRVLTTKNPYDYFIEHGEMRGMQYEMIREFVNFLNQKYIKKNEIKITFEMVPVDFNDLIPMLKAGKGDIIAVGITETEERKKLIDFTVPYQMVDDVIVTRKELLKKSWEDKTFVIQKNSSYSHALKRYYKKISMTEINPNLSPENIIELVSLRKYDYTLANSFWAENMTKRFENLVILNDRPFRKNVSIRWGVRKKSPKLLSEINNFLPKIKKGTLIGNVFSHKYYKDLGRFQTGDFNLKKSIISKYDRPIKKYGNIFGFDWKLLSAIALQESRFNQGLINKWGATGLFQIKKTTASEPYINISSIEGEENFESNIHAGVKYLAWIKKTYFDKELNVDNNERIRFTIAAYNAGPKRVLEAISKAKQMGLDSKKWFRNVEKAMLELGFSEPVIYVSEINKYYVSYLLMGIK